MSIRYFAASTAAATLLSSAALAGGLQNGWKSFRDPTIQNHGHEWANIGHAGNADWVGSGGGSSIVRVGGVNYRYRIAKTEVTNRQYFEFVLAYAPYVSSQFAGSFQFTGTGIGLASGGGYSLAASTADQGAEMGWRFAARYVNWLHNDKASGQWAFESGVYDTSTFGPFSGGGVITDQRERSEDARYFLPTRDEWIKAVHFDPDRYGDGQEGYWLYPYSADTVPVAGAPGTPGVQTNAGTGVGYPIMSYPDAVTPWGLFDASGGVQEWLETISIDERGRLTDSSTDGSSPVLNLDWIAASQAKLPTSLIGIRLASVIPAPAAPLVVGLAGAVLGARRRRAARRSHSS